MTRLPSHHFPVDQHRRVDVRMCLGCIDDHAPSLMTEVEMAKWLGVTIADVRAMPVAGDYSTSRGVAIPLYAREPVTSVLPAGWRVVLAMDPARDPGNIR